MHQKLLAAVMGFLLAAVTAGGLYGQDLPRLNVTIFQYRGTSTAPGQQSFGEFLGVLDDKVRNLGQELAIRHDGATYLQGLQMFESTDPPPATPQLQGFAAQSGSIGLLSGTVFPSPAPAQVRSRYFFGDLQGSLNFSTLNLQLSIQASEFGSVRDSHSVAVLYALAMDAKRFGSSREVIVECLSRAYTALEDLDTNEPGIRKLKAAVEKELHALRSGQ